MNTNAATLSGLDTNFLANKINKTTLELSHATFLNLPTEIRQQIYDYVVPTCRLAPFPYLDSEWSMRSTELRGIPDLLFTCRKVYKEVTPLVYSRAILEIAPAQQGHMWFNIEHSSTGSIIPYSYSRVVNTFRIYRAEHLKLIRSAHIFSNQADVIDGSCYESLVQWLVEHTGTEHIQLSSRPMTRIRGSAGFDLHRWRAAFYDKPLDLRSTRTIRIFTKVERPPWEYEKMMRLQCKARDGTLNPMQIYFWSTTEAGGGILQLDPRWLTRLNDEPEKIEALYKGAPLIDEVMLKILEGPQLQAYKDNARYFEGQYWIYQMIVVSQSV